MRLTVGTRLGVYEVLGTLGKGGMGEVYRARDTRLQREVALKILPEAFANDPDRLARFEREARVLASLNHPGIAQIFGLEESGGHPALVMELVAGRTLEEIVHAPAAGRPAGLPLDEALPIARQIADALEAAHEAGIVHRDLKPANVKVRADGVVKVLDFGLARAVAEGDTESDPSDPRRAAATTALESPVMTRAGAVLGTAAYMSPEQARGRPVDKRSDIWSFGVILFEMLSGRRLFAEATTSDTIAAVLTRELDLASLPAPVPAPVRSLVARCLERDPKRRLRDIGEARWQLDQAAPASAVVSGAPASAPEPSAHAAAAPGRRSRWLAGAAVVALAAVATVLWQRGRSAPAAPARPAAGQSVAVLPFVNQSGNPDDEYFSDGMTDELASALTKVPGLRVAARSSAFAFKGKDASAREVGAKLNVTSVLEGTVRRAGSRLRVTAQLVGVGDGLAIWADRYERDAKDVFAVQDDITTAIVGALRLTLGSAAGAGAQATRPETAEAHDLYLRGRFFMLKQTEDGLRKSLEYYGQAHAKDPLYAPAYAGEAFAWAWLADAVLAPREAYPKAKAAALKAVELDPEDAYARTMLATVLWFYEWQADAAEEQFQRALQSNPASMDAHNLHALCLCAGNRWDDGIAEAERAIALEPLNVWPAWTREYCLCLARRWDETIAQHRKVVELDPSYYYLDSWVGIAYREKRMYAESAAVYESARRLTGAPLAGLAVTYARMGRTAEARAILREFDELAKRRYVWADQIATIHASLGETDQALALLDQAFEARSGSLSTSVTSAAFDPLRGSPRFAAMLEKMGLWKPPSGVK